MIRELYDRAAPEREPDLLAVGYTKQTVLEVIVGTSLKALSNYTTRIVGPKLDDHFAPVAWSTDMASAARTANKAAIAVEGRVGYHHDGQRGLYGQCRQAWVRANRHMLSTRVLEPVFWG